MMSFFKTHNPKKYITITFHDPTSQITGFTSNNRLPVTVESGSSISEALTQFNKFRAPNNQVTTHANTKQQIFQNTEINVTLIS